MLDVKCDGKNNADDSTVLIKWSTITIALDYLKQLRIGWFCWDYVEDIGKE